MMKGKETKHNIFRGDKKRKKRQHTRGREDDAKGRERERKGVLIAKGKERKVEGHDESI